MQTSIAFLHKQQNRCMNLLSFILNILSIYLLSIESIGFEFKHRSSSPGVLAPSRTSVQQTSSVYKWKMVVIETMHFCYLF